MTYPQPGRLIVISAPSGAGKTSLVRALLSADPRITVSVSHTTRQPRPNEINGRDYHFVTPGDFGALLLAGGFLEHAEVFGNQYGTAREQVQALLAAGQDVVLEIDWQGARQVRDRFAACISIFILPPSLAALRERLTARQTDSPEVIARRLAEARAEMTHYSEFDCVVVNDDFARTLRELQEIIAGERTAFEPGRAELKPVLENLLA